MTPAQIHAFFAALQAANPQPQTELEYTSVFELLTAVLLSAQATDVGVNKATRRLFLVANTPQAIIDLGPERLEGYIKTIGLYRSKARHLMATCHILVEQHGGVVPRTREALEQLPGVGRKTANGEYFCFYSQIFTKKAQAFSPINNGAPRGANSLIAHKHNARPGFPYVMA